MGRPPVGSRDEGGVILQCKYFCQTQGEGPGWGISRPSEEKRNQLFLESWKSKLNAR